MSTFGTRLVEKGRILGQLTHEYQLWILTAAYATHVLEEHAFNWKSWAENSLQLAVTWDQFYVTNAAVIILGVCTAGVGWKLPAFALMFPALALVNAIVFHVLPTVVNRRYSPGTVTAIVLFLPVGTWTYWGAFEDNVLNVQNVVISVIGGIVLMAYPVVLIKRRDKKKVSKTIGKSSKKRKV